MIVDEATQQTRENRMALILLATMLAIPIFGTIIGAIFMLMLVMQIFSKSANIFTDLGALLVRAALYLAVHLGACFMASETNSAGMWTFAGAIMITVNYFLVARFKEFLS